MRKEPCTEGYTDAGLGLSISSLAGRAEITQKSNNLKLDFVFSQLGGFVYRLGHTSASSEYEKQSGVRVRG